MCLLISSVSGDGDIMSWTIQHLQILNSIKRSMLGKGLYANKMDYFHFIGIAGLLLLNFLLLLFPCKIFSAIFLSSNRDDINLGNTLHIPRVNSPVLLCHSFKNRKSVPDVYSEQLAKEGIFSREDKVSLIIYRTRSIIII